MSITVQRRPGATPLSEDAIRDIHRPNYRHRFSILKYPPATKFSGAQRPCVCYALSGTFRFTFGLHSVDLERGDHAHLPEGDFDFAVLGDDEAHVACVYELPFDVVHHRRDGVEYLRDHGVRAEARDWSMGKTILAVRHPSKHRGITVYADSCYLAPHEGKWAVYVHSDLYDVPVLVGSLKEACDYIIAKWQEP